MVVSANRLVLFFLSVALTIITATYFIVNTVHYRDHSNIFSLASTLDIVFFIPFIYYLLIRKSSVPKITILPIVFLSFGAASFILPASGHSYLKLVEYLLAPVELFVIGYLIYKVRLSTREYRSLANGRNDFVLNLNSTLCKIIGTNRAAELFTTEISVIHYGIFGWKSTKEVGSENAFSYHKRSGYSSIVGVFFILMLIETTGFHLLLSLWSTTAAWVLTGLSVYGIVFLMADHNAAKKRPILIDDEYLHIRIAFRWYVAIPLANIANIHAGTQKIKEDKAYLRMALMGTENIIIELKETIEAKGIYGITKPFKRVGLMIDDKNGFIDCISKAIIE